MIRICSVVRRVSNKSWKGLLAISIYLILTLVLLYPFSVFNMESTLLGNGGDGYQSLWNLWWVKQSTLTLTNPYVTDHLYYPYGADLYVHSLSPAAGFLTIPFQIAFGLVFTYNLIAILSFILAGFGAYLLAHHVTGDWKASFFAGLLFTFSTYHFARALENLNLVSIQWIPFYTLFLLKMRTERSSKNILLAATFLILSGLSADLQYVLFLAILTVFFVAFQAISNLASFREFLIRLGNMTLLSFAIMLPVLAPMIFGLFSGKYEYAISSPSDSVALSADLLAFFTPNSRNLFFGNFTTNVTSSFSSSPEFPIEGIAYIGFVVLTLTVYATVRLTKTAKFWMLSSIGFMTLALGPMLHVMGATSFTVFKVNIPLPELFIYYVFPAFRAPSRFIVMATLCLSVVAAIALKQANLRIGGFKHGRLLVLACLTLLSMAFIVENNMLPYPIVEDTSVSQFYHTLSFMDGNFSVLDLPQTYQSNNLFMYYGTVSEKPIVGGSISRISPQNSILQQAIPLIRQTTNVLTGENLTNPTDVILQDLNQTNINSLKFFRVRYVVLHKGLLDATTFRTMSTYLNALLGLPIYTDEKIRAYEVKTTIINGTFTFMTSGWYNLQNEDVVPTRWMGTNATIQIYSPKGQYCAFSFTVGTRNPTTKLSVYLNGEWMGNVQLNTITPENVITQGFLREGINDFCLSSNQTYVPGEINVTSSDTRRLSVYIQNLEVTSY